MTALSWIVRITAAVILAQTLFFKFSAAPESVAILMLLVLVLLAVLAQASLN